MSGILPTSHLEPHPSPPLPFPFSYCAWSSGGALGANGADRIFLARAGVVRAPVLRAQTHSFRAFAKYGGGPVFSSNLSHSVHRHVTEVEVSDRVNSLLQSGCVQYGRLLIYVTSVS